MGNPAPTDLFSILSDEEKRKIVRDVYKRHAEAMSADVVRAEVLREAQALAPELAKGAVEAFAREFRYGNTGFSSRTDSWHELVKSAIARGVQDHLDSCRIAITPKDGVSR